MTVAVVVAVEDAVEVAGGGDVDVDVDGEIVLRCCCCCCCCCCNRLGPAIVTQYCDQSKSVYVRKNSTNASNG